MLDARWYEVNVDRMYVLILSKDYKTKSLYKGESSPTTHLWKCRG
jgi:hypothetical protein